jgi:putative hydrolases of HD superfamily
MSRLSERHRAILEFLQVCDEFKTIERQGWLSEERRQETDAEHCWHMALFALLLADELEVHVDRAHALAMILVHDLVEIYAGDAYAFDYVGEAQHDKEQASAERLFGLLPPDLGEKVKGWWLEFEEGRTDEAKFARSLDRLQAFNQSILSRGRDWREHHVHRDKTHTRMRPARTFDPTITALVDHLYAVADEHGFWPMLDEGWNQR